MEQKCAEIEAELSEIERAVTAEVVELDGRGECNIRGFMNNDL
jgi:hypothetical protein